MAKWIVSILSTVLIWGAGIAGFAFIHASSSDQLKLADTIAPGAAAQAEPSAGKAGDLKSIINVSQSKVFCIQTPGGLLGSGFLYNDKGDIITNSHVVAGESMVKVIASDSKEYTGEVIGKGDSMDVAVVRVEELKGKHPLSIDTGRKAEIGDSVVALGSPLGLQNTATVGTISGVNRTLEIEGYSYKNVYQIAASIAPGNSGGPLISQKTGKVIGINSAGADEGNIGFSIPMDEVMKQVKEWSEKAF